MLDTEIRIPNQANIDAIINSKIKPEAQNNAAHQTLKPLTKDAEVTSEEEFQMQLWRDAIAKDRAVGKRPQTFFFDGPMPTRDPGLDKLIAKLSMQEEKGNDVETVVYES